MREFRFGFNIRDNRTSDALARTCRDGEALGYDVVLIPDHLGGNCPAPFPLMVAAACATDRMRVGSFVLNVGFWNPSLLARDAAAVDLLTDGRLELGLGAGHMKSEFDAAGIPWQPFDERVDRLADTLDQLARLFNDETDGYRTIQRPAPPLMLGGTSEGVLKLAAERAAIGAYGGVFQAKGKPPGKFRAATSAEMDDKVRFFRQHAGDRLDEIEANLLIQFVKITDHPRAAAEELIAERGADISADELLESPVTLFGPLHDVADKVREHRDRYGISYFTVHEPYVEEFAKVIEVLR